MSDVVLEPATPSDVAELLRTAAEDKRRIVPRGAATKLSWANADAAAATPLSTRRIQGELEHDAGDLVATIPAGLSFADANRALARAGQWLPLDPARADRATIGGIVATNDSGPRRHRYGAPRDLILGVEVALTNGRVIKAGGRVVKNVAGYDLSRLLCGSFGRLGILTRATFKLSPLPPASCTVRAHVRDTSQAADLALVVAATASTPSALELAGPVPQLLVRFESTPRAVKHMSDALAALLRQSNIACDMLTGEDERDVWEQHAAHIWSAHETIAKVTTLPTTVASVTASLEHQVTLRSIEWAVSGRAALGVLHVGLGGPLADQLAVLSGLRNLVRPQRGHLELLEGPAALRAQLDDLSVDDSSGALPVMNAVRRQFDPHDVLGPPYGPRQNWTRS